MKEKPFPVVDEALLKSLDEHFPMKDFAVVGDLNKLNYHYGQRSVVQFLRSKFYEQNENILNVKE